MKERMAEGLGVFDSDRGEPGGNRGTRVAVRRSGFSSFRAQGQG